MMTIELWSVDLDDVATRPEVLQAASSSDRAASGRLHTETLRRRFTARRAVTRSILGRSVGRPAAELQIVRRCAHCGGHNHGRPELVGAPIEFSVSSCGGRAVIAVADQRIGVDIELGRPSQPWRHGLSRAVLAPAERARLEALPASERTRTFLQMWVAKEAVLKADGRGLLVDPRLVDTSPVMLSGVGYVDLDHATWMVQSVTPESFGTDNLLAAVAEVGGAQSPSVLVSRRIY